jgi:hypothetical protein
MKQLWPNLRYSSGICLEEVRKTMKHLGGPTETFCVYCNGPPGAVSGGASLD